MAYKLTHPDSAQEIEREAAHVASYLSNGWRMSPHAKEPETPAPAVELEKTPTRSRGRARTPRSK